ncbi:hypothetical protein [Nostoc sp. UHCC 0251]|uniref:hypothetical protein n=1 Tax=Nostoc sp. UHCC 0251 TaxID=3110240 RepID=UPI002B20924C|nr:hypothetical protein [Nostoc sp. UHCC 0251]MEA5625297.1 hypothetical protein [Nostoc sp. UHCC 0251]
MSNKNKLGSQVAGGIVVVLFMMGFKSCTHQIVYNPAPQYTNTAPQYTNSSRNEEPPNSLFENPSRSPEPQQESGADDYTTHFPN